MHSYRERRASAKSSLRPFDLIKSTLDGLKWYNARQGYEWKSLLWTMKEFVEVKLQERRFGSLIRDDQELGAGRRACDFAVRRARARGGHKSQ